MVSWRTTTLRAWRGLREFLAVQVELYERTALLDRPWEENSLHGAGDGWARAQPEETLRRGQARIGRWHLEEHVIPSPGTLTKEECTARSWHELNDKLSDKSP